MTLEKWNFYNFIIFYYLYIQCMFKAPLNVAVSCMKMSVCFIISLHIFLYACRLNYVLHINNKLVGRTAWTFSISKIHELFDFHQMMKMCETDPCSCVKKRRAL